MRRIEEFRIGDIRTYVSKKKTIEIVRVSKIKDGIIYANRLNENLEAYEVPPIKLNVKSDWRTFITNDDKRSLFRKLLDMINN